MTAPKLTDQLAVAQRAYHATQPTDAEVQAAVRRARLALRRSKRGRVPLAKPLMLLVLGMGGLAYAKPSAMQELADQVLTLLPRRDAGPASLLAKHESEAVLPAGAAAHGATPAKPVEATEPHESTDSNTPAPSDAPAAPLDSANELQGQPREPASSHGATSSRSGAPTSNHAGRPRSGGVGSHRIAAQWGSVGKALAQGDEQAALTALSALARSDDPHTRDKAELGRAQLLMARGERTQACSLARSLSERGAETRIERQAQALLKSCAR